MKRCAVHIIDCLNVIHVFLRNDNKVNQYLSLYFGKPLDMASIKPNKTTITVGKMTSIKYPFTPNCEQLTPNKK